MKFSELAVGQKFKLNGEEYQKIEPVKISCCKSVVAVNTATNAKVPVKPDTEVEVVAE